MRMGRAALAVAAAFGLLAAEARADVLKDDPDFLSIAGGYFDFNRQKDPGGEFRLEYRSDYKLWIFKPFAAGGVSTTGHTFLGAGVLIDVYFGNRWVVTPSFAPQWYTGGNRDLDLGYALEFRSQLEIAYRFDDRSRLGLAVSHSSNASLGDTNPGTESIMLYYSIPMSHITGLFK
jgi:hypothetical protein